MSKTKPKKKNKKSPQIKTDADIIKRLLTRAVENIFPSPDGLKKLLLSGRQLTIYQGFDPTGDSLHIGHTVGMRKLRDFQLLGHRVIFLCGDLTGRVGDPTDRSATRKKLTKKEVEENLKGYKEQASKILPFDDKENPVEVLYNSQWLGKLNFKDLLELGSEFTVQQMIKRDMFRKRIEDDHPISIHEFMYPIMQAYDAFNMDIDVQVGGNDQLFNMLCGRDLILRWKKKETFVLAGQLLVEPGGTKMGKTEGNMVMLADSPEDMFGKIMAFSDEQIIQGFEILTDVPMEEVEQMEKDMNSDSVNPMDLKKNLALTITTEHKGEAAARKAQKHFEDVFQKRGESDSDTLKKIPIGTNSVPIIGLLTKHTTFAESNSKAKRLVEQGAVSLDGKVVTDKAHTVSIPKDGSVLKVGRQVALILP